MDFSIVLFSIISYLIIVKQFLVHITTPGIIYHILSLPPLKKTLSLKAGSKGENELFWGCLKLLQDFLTGFTILKPVINFFKRSFTVQSKQQLSPLFMLAEIQS